MRTYRRDAMPCGVILTTLVFFLAATAVPAAAQNTHIDSFELAKKLAPQIYVDHREEFYCGCRFSGKEVDLDSCGYQPKNDVRRAKRLEWEHVVPAEAFGQAFPEWREGHPSCVDSKGRPFKGRNCAKKVSIAFRHMEGDLHNLESLRKVSYAATR